MDTGQHQRQREVPGKVTIIEGRGELPMQEIITTWSTVGIYRHGAHVTHFKKKGQPPLLFLSQCSRFEENQPIRGGIPVIFPWFGPREGMAQHGFARVKAWELKEAAPAPDGSVSVRFSLPDCPEASSFPPFSVDYIVTVNASLTLELVVTNKSPDSVFTYEDCLHTYFEVGDINMVSIKGLKGTSYVDKVAGFAQKTETDDLIRISSEADRVYQDTTTAVEIRDERLSRTIRVEKWGSKSTVVWNPWIAKAQQMPDFGNDEYQRMVCVESGNIGPNSVRLEPGQSSSLKVRLSSEP